MYRSIFVGVIAMIINLISPLAYILNRNHSLLPLNYIASTLPIICTFNVNTILCHESESNHNHRQQHQSIMSDGNSLEMTSTAHAEVKRNVIIGESLSKEQDEYLKNVMEAYYARPNRFGHEEGNVDGMRRVNVIRT